MKKARHQEIYTVLRNEILKGKFAESAAFPSDNALARRFGVGRQTVYWAVSRLRDEKLVSRKRGSGTFITKTARKSGGAIVAIAPSFPSSEIYPVICRELSRICQENGRLFCYADACSDNARDALARLKNSIRSMAGEGVAGIIFRPVDYYQNSSEINLEIASAIRKAGIPLVLLDCEMGEPEISSGFDVVGIDNMVAGMCLAKHVTELGTRRILFVYRARSSVNIRLRQIGIKAILDEISGTSLKCVRMPEGGLPGLSRLIREFKPDAILAAGDFIAANVLKLLAKMRLRVPDDVLVAGIDDVAIAGMTTPALTSVRQPCAEIARAAFDMLAWRIENPGAVPRRVALAADLIVRESTTRKNKTSKQRRASK